MSNVEFKAGDKVRIVRKAEFNPDSMSFWDDEMDAFVGNGEVHTVQAYVAYYGPEDGVGLEGDFDGAAGYLWPQGSLELVTE